MVILKTDPSKVFVREFTILKETNTDEIVVEIYMTIEARVKTSINLNGVAIPSNIMQHYNWSSFHEPYVSVDIFGQVLANNSGIGETAIVLGSYKYNPKWLIVVYINII